MATRILVVRHGRTVWNRENRFRGQADVELDDFGLRQAEATGQYVASRWPLAAVYASRLKRAMQTGAAVAHAQGLSVQPHEGLLDMSFGKLQGLTMDEANARYADVLKAWLETPHQIHFPGGEDLDTVRQRVMTGLEDLVCRHRGESVALVSHTVVIKTLLCAVLGLGNEHFWRIGQDTCAVNAFDAEDGAADGGGAIYTIQLINDTSHMCDLSAHA